MILEYEGYECVLAPTAPDGIATIERDPPDLVFLDIKMPIGSVLNDPGTSGYRRNMRRPTAFSHSQLLGALKSPPERGSYNEDAEKAGGNEGWVDPQNPAGQKLRGRRLLQKTAKAIRYPLMMKKPSTGQKVPRVILAPRATSGSRAKLPSIN